MKTAIEQTKELESMIEQAKNQDDILVKNWQRSIQILKSKIEHGRNNCNDDSNF
jgi:hypothetical protein